MNLAAGRAVRAGQTTTLAGWRAVFVGSTTKSNFPPGRSSHRRMLECTKRTRSLGHFPGGRGGGCWWRERGLRAAHARGQGAYAGCTSGELQNALCTSPAPAIRRWWSGNVCVCWSGGGCCGALLPPAWPRAAGPGAAQRDSVAAHRHGRRGNVARPQPRAHRSRHSPHTASGCSALARRARASVGCCPLVAAGDTHTQAAAVARPRASIGGLAATPTQRRRQPTHTQPQTPTAAPFACSCCRLPAPLAHPAAHIRPEMRIPISHRPAVPWLLQAGMASGF